MNSETDDEDLYSASPIDVPSSKRTDKSRDCGFLCSSEIFVEIAMEIGILSLDHGISAGADAGCNAHWWWR